MSEINDSLREFIKAVSQDPFKSNASCLGCLAKSFKNISTNTMVLNNTLRVIANLLILLYIYLR